jgi:nitrite reductase (NO-forming)
MRRRSPLVLLTAGCLVAGGLLSACGGGGGGGGSTLTASNGKVTIEARDVKFNAKQIDSTPGALEVTLVEKGSLEHTFVVEDSAGKAVDGKLTVTPGNDRDTGAYDLQPGTYTFFCDIPGHRGQGMEGKIVVK